jgi:hypothetical protein
MPKINQIDRIVNMRLVSVSKVDLLHVLVKYNLEETPELFNDVRGLLEKQLNVRLKWPISEDLKTEIRIKMLTLKHAWLSKMQLTGDSRVEVYMREISRQVYKINVAETDIDKPFSEQYPMIEQSLKLPVTPASVEKSGVSSKRSAEENSFVEFVSKKGTVRDLINYRELPKKVLDGMPSEIRTVIESTDQSRTLNTNQIGI